MLQLFNWHIGHILERIYFHKKHSHRHHQHNHDDDHHQLALDSKRADKVLKVVNTLNSKAMNTEVMI